MTPPSDIPPRVLILNSAHRRYIRGSDRWIAATSSAVERIAKRPCRLLVGDEPAMWGLTAWLAGRLGMTVEVLVRASDTPEGHCLYRRMLDGYGIAPETAEPRFLGNGAASTAKDTWLARDRAAVAAADIILPVSLRPEGKLARLLESPDAAVKVHDTFRIPWQEEDGNGRPQYAFDKRPNPFPPGEWLVHWTRSFAGPWEDEAPKDFFADLLAHPESLVRSARATLIRMLRSGLIRGTRWRIAGGERMVSFTGAGSDASVALMRWRQRFLRYTFEPYGISIRREALESCGALPVRYLDTDATDERTAFTQSSGTRADWTRECEWRLAGNLDLTRLDPGAWFPVVYEPSDAKLVSDAAKKACHVLFP